VFTTSHYIHSKLERGGAMGNGIRDRVEELLKEVPPVGQLVYSDGDVTAKKLFAKLTGQTQADLVKLWETKPTYTTCMELAGHVGSLLGSSVYLGQFKLEELLTKIGKPYAWVPAAGGAQPKYGDIFTRYPPKMHMGISLDFKDDDTWNTVESGQGGKAAGHDALGRFARSWANYTVAGWVDLELYFEGFPVPEWLVGWWVVTWQKQTFYYNFDRNHQVIWTQIQPPNSSLPPSDVRDTGRLMVGDSLVTIT
jgi:hypothetical protein